MHNFKVTPRQLWLLYSIASLTFVFSLWYPYVSEEGVYTITSIEMWSHHQWLLPTLFGSNYGRPPVFNWLIIPTANLFGWTQMLVAARLITALATVATGIVLAWLAKALTRDNLFAALCAIVFFSCDILFYRGWLAVSDSLFAFFIFTAIASVWVGLYTGRTYLFWLAVIWITLGALTKVQTAYVFYLVALGVLFLNSDYRKLLITINCLFAHIFGLGLFIVWYYVLAHGAHLGTAGDIITKFYGINWLQYLNQLWSFPLETALRFLPASGIILYLWFHKRLKLAIDKQHWLFTAALIFIINWLPYWLSPDNCIRYIQPIYPVAALIMSYFIFQAKEHWVGLMVKWFIVLLVLKVLFVAIFFPYYQNNYRGNYQMVAKDVINRVHDFPLYAFDTSATGISVTANIDSLIYPKLPLAGPPEEWNTGFVLSYNNDPKLGALVESYKLGGNSLYLLCRGAACE